MDQHRDLAFGVDPQHVRALRLVEVLHVKRHHDEVEVQTFLQSGDLSLRLRTCSRGQRTSAYGL